MADEQLYCITNNINIYKNPKRPANALLRMHVKSSNTSHLIVHIINLSQKSWCNIYIEKNLLYAMVQKCLKVEKVLELS